MKKYYAEFLATFILVFCGTGAGIVNQETHGMITHLGVAMAWGLVVTAMVYALGHVSGAHMNPVVSVVFTLNKQLAPQQLLPYIISQAAGAIAASAVLKILFPGNVFLGTTFPAGSAQQSLILEVILTFILLLVVLFLSNGTDVQKMFAGLAVGAVVALEALFAGPVCGASMNPVRSLAPAIVSGHTEYIWIYLVAPTIGGLLALLTYTSFKK